MNNYHSYLFLINPASGSARDDWQELISSMMPANHHYEFVVWDHPEKREEILKQVRSSKAEVLVAVGGDGTINLLADIVMESKKVLGILPSGSGNGLARHLRIPLNHKKAIHHLLQTRSRKMDVASVNGKHFLCTAGAGFDALIGEAFADRDKTGLWGYVGKVIKHVFAYKAETYRLTWGSNIKDKKAFLITFANASQYGNNAFIAPKAKINDGKLNVCLIRPFPILMAIPMSILLFTRKIYKSRFVETFEADSIRLRRNAGPFHMDGDPVDLGNELEIGILPDQIDVIY
jgi:YegS/Rv2252/BmrU family lipid kinase